MITLTEKQTLEMLLNADERVAVHANDIRMLSELVVALQKQVGKLQEQVRELRRVLGYLPD